MFKHMPKKVKKPHLYSYQYIFVGILQEMSRADQRLFESFLRKKQPIYL